MERPEIDWDDTRRSGQVVSLKLEKQQVAGLAEFLHGLMGDLPPIDEPAVEVAETSARFEDPEEADWVVGSLGVTYQQSTDRLVLIAEELLRDEDLVPAQARFPMRRDLVAAFIVRARELVAAGRPPCPWCGAPLDPAVDGWCPCAN